MRNIFKRKDFDDLENYEEDNYDERIADYNEPQIIESFTDEELEEYKNKHEKKYHLYKRIINIVFIVIFLILTFIAVDVIAVSRYDVGPFFAIKTTTYKDGGTKEYYGIGYKVIKYHQVQGRRDKEIGFWNLKYNTNPVDLKDVDLAIEFQNDYEKASKKYYKKFIRLTSTIKKIDTKNNTLTLQYLDDEGKYTLEIICKMADKKSNLDELVNSNKADIIGTVKKFETKTKNSSNKVYIDSCFASPNTDEFIEVDE